MSKFILRWAFAFGLLAATYNPTAWNYVSWSTRNHTDSLPLVVLLGLLLCIGYIIYLRATLRTIGGFGMFRVLAEVGAGLWVLADFGWLAFADPSRNLWIGLVALSLVLGIGISWSHVRRRLSGQADMDDVSS